MAIKSITHFNIRPFDLEKSMHFYVEVIGLEVGHRPPFGFPGYWLYSNGFPFLHLLGRRPGEGPIDRFECSDARRTGHFDHIALEATNLSETELRLRGHGVPYDKKVVPQFGQTQIFIIDPDGVRIELSFERAEGEEV